MSSPWWDMHQIWTQTLQTNCGVGKKQKKVLFHFDFLKKYTKKEKIEYKMKMKERAESWGLAFSNIALHESLFRDFVDSLWTVCVLPSFPSKINSDKNSNKNQKETRRSSIFWAVFANGVFQFRLLPGWRPVHIFTH